MDLLHFIIPFPDFLLRVCFFGEVHNLLGVKRQLCLSASQSIINGYAALSKPLKGIGRPDLFPEKEVIH